MSSSTIYIVHVWQVLLRPPWPRDWVAYNKYASRVRELYVHTSDLCRAELKILDILSLLYAKPSMAPQIRVLHWVGSHLLYANLFVGPFLQAADLRSFHFDHDHDGDAPATLANLIHSSPSIESVVMFDGTGSRTSRTLATLDSTSWAKLRVLDLQGRTSPEFVPTLGRLPVLEALHLNFGDNSGHSSSNPSPLEPLFPRLTLLCVFSAGLNSIPIQLLLGPGSSPQLTDLTLIAEDYAPTAYFLQDWFTTFLSNRLGLTEITVFAPTVRLPLECQATLETIRPLFALKKLVNLTVSFPFALNDATLRTIAKTWPTLRTLNLGGTNQPYHHTDVTLGGVVRLVANNPFLRDLTINFDASDVATARKNGADIKSTCAHLRELWAGGSRILNAPSVAKFLRIVFPRVRVMEDDPGTWDEYEDPDGTRHRKGWLRVDALLEASVATTTM